MNRPSRRESMITSRLRFSSGRIYWRYLWAASTAIASVGTVMPLNCLVARPSSRINIGADDLAAAERGAGFTGNDLALVGIMVKNNTELVQVLPESAWLMDSAIPSAMLSVWPRLLRQPVFITLFL